MRSRLAIAGLAACLSGAVVLALAGEIKITALVDDGRVFVSFASPEALSDEAQSVIKSGLQLTFTYDVDLRRPSTLWFDDTLATTTVAALVKFDSLTGGYQITKLHDGKVVSAKRTEAEGEVRALLTEFEKIPLDTTTPLEPNVDYYVRVRLHRSPRTTFSLWSLWPWGRDEGSGRAEFTYIR